MIHLSIASAFWGGRRVPQLLGGTPQASRVGVAASGVCLVWYWYHQLKIGVKSPTKVEMDCLVDPDVGAIVNLRAVRLGNSKGHGLRIRVTSAQR